MVDFNKQKDEWNQVVRERKYRPSFFGFPVHVDWSFLLIIFLIGLILIMFFALSTYSDISELSESDFTDKVEIGKTSRVDVDKYDQILKRIEED